MGRNLKANRCQGTKYVPRFKAGKALRDAVDACAMSQIFCWGNPLGVLIIASVLVGVLLFLHNDQVIALDLIVFLHRLPRLPSG